MNDQQDETVLLDVGHGNSAVVVSSGKVAIIDAGQGATLLEHLRGVGVTRVDAVIISHADKDHFGGLVGVLASGTVSVARVYLNGDGTKGSREWDDLARVLDDLNGVTQVVFGPPPDMSVKLGTVRLEFLAPSVYLTQKGAGGDDRQGRTIRSNSLSIVVRLVVGERGRILFAGDIDRIGLDEIMHHGQQMRADILVFPHHGGQVGGDMTSYAEHLCRHVGAKYVVFSIARRIQPNNPAPEIMAGVRRALPKSHVMCTQLSHRCSADVPSLTPTHMTSAAAAGRAGVENRCCAGTLIVPHTTERRLQPTPQKHRKYLDLIPQALCRRSFDLDDS